MSEECQRLHEFASARPRFSFPFAVNSVPKNGIYVLFERGETAHGVDRIVRIGTHTGANNLGPRLAEHFLRENKDRSIFRKNIGRALLRRSGDPFLESWQIDMTTRAAKEKHADSYDRAELARIESLVTEYMRHNFTFTVIACEDERLLWESALIAIVSACHECGPSESWLGLHSPVRVIAERGLWLVQGVGKPLQPGWSMEQLIDASD